MIDTHLVTCCQEIPEGAGAAIATSLLAEIAVLDYYNGPMGGFVRCSACGCEHSFRTLDWDDEQGVRVVSLAQVPRGTFASLAEFFRESPARERWIPQQLSRATDEDLGRIEPFVAGLVALADAPSSVVAWDVYSSDVLAARRIDASVCREVVGLFDRAEPFDWFAYLGLARDAPRAPAALS